VRRAAAIGLALTAVVCVAAATGGVRAAAMEKKARGESAWTHPEFAGFAVDRIAMLPTATYDANASVEKEVERAVGAALRGAGYRWISGTATRNLLRANGADSLLASLRAGVLEQGRADSLEAPVACAVLRCDALLTVRVDQWEQREVEWNQSGKPTTTVHLRAALVDSTGALLWSDSGSETGEGPYHVPENQPGQSTIQRTQSTQGGAPSYSEVLVTILDRFASSFPAKPAAEGASGSTDTPE